MNAVEAPVCRTCKASSEETIYIMSTEDYKHTCVWCHEGLEDPKGAAKKARDLIGPKLCESSPTVQKALERIKTGESIEAAIVEAILSLSKNNSDGENSKASLKPLLAIPRAKYSTEGLTP